MMIRKMAVAVFAVIGLSLSLMSTANADGPRVSPWEFNHVHKYQTRHHVEAVFGNFDGKVVSRDCPSPVPTSYVFGKCVIERYPTNQGRDYVLIEYRYTGYSHLRYLFQKTWVHAAS